jgi:hypothetical protein
LVSGGQEVFPVFAGLDLGTKPERHAPRPDQASSAFLGLLYFTPTLRVLSRPRRTPFPLPLIFKS